VPEDRVAVVMAVAAMAVAGWEVPDLAGHTAEAAMGAGSEVSVFVGDTAALPAVLRAHLTM
jgi:hypothetical protein